MSLIGVDEIYFNDLNCSQPMLIEQYNIFTTIIYVRQSPHGSAIGF